LRPLPTRQLFGMDWLTENTFHDQTTSCLVWLGPYSTVGYPIRHEGGRQVLVHRERWALAHRIKLPANIYLKRLCPDRRCCAPWHYAVSNPRKVARGYGCSDWHLRRVRGALRRWQAQRGKSGLCWDAGDLKGLSLVPGVVNEVAVEQDVSPWVVLSAYASMACPIRTALGTRRAIATGPRTLDQ